MIGLVSCNLCERATDRCSPSETQARLSLRPALSSSIGPVGEETLLWPFTSIHFWSNTVWKQRISKGNWPTINFLSKFHQNLKSSFSLKLSINSSVKSKHRTFDDMVKLLIQERKEGDILHEGFRINTKLDPKPTHQC